MSDGSKSTDQKPNELSDETVARMKEQITHGVGYRRPPEHTRFQKGQSGNPSGRPRAAKADGLTLEEQPLLHAVHERAQKTVRMREGDIVSEVGAREALIQSILATALKGNARSQGLALDLIRSADIQRARDRAERQQAAKRYKANQAEAIAAAIEAGKDTRLILPHPDDIVLDDDYGFHFIGPLNEAELGKVEESVHYRDALILQDALDSRLGDRMPSARPAASSSGTQSGALLFATVLNTTLPARYQLDDATIVHRLARHERINLRQLLKETYQAWRKAGVKVKRGVRFTDLDTARRTVGYTIDFGRAFRDGRLDLDAIARDGFDDVTLELMERYGLDAQRP